MKSVLLALVVFFSASRMHAQETSDNYTSGGFGHFMHGPCFYMPGTLLDYLEQPGVMNASIQPRMGTMSGGEGAALLGNFIIGGGGFAETALRHINDSARLQISLNGGYFKFGYVWHKCHNNLAYAYGGLGWGNLMVHIENFTRETGVHFDNDQPIRPGFKKDYWMNMNYYDLGISFKHIFNAEENGHGGFMAGLDLGTMITQPTSEWWSNSDEVVFGPPVPRMGFNPYVRITIGGGGFHE